MPCCETAQEHSKFNTHKCCEDWTLTKFVNYFLNKLKSTGYITLQLYEEAEEMFTARIFGKNIVVGNSTPGPQSMNVYLPLSCSAVDFDRIWVFSGIRRWKNLENYLRILLTKWYSVEDSAGNISSVDEFFKNLELWNEASEKRYWTTFDKHDKIHNECFSYLKEKEDMEKLTGKTFQESVEYFFKTLISPCKRCPRYASCGMCKHEKWKDFKFKKYKELEKELKEEMEEEYNAYFRK